MSEPKLNQTRVVRELKPTLGAIHLWGIAVGLVISGDYFGWSYGWASAGTLGFLIAVAVISLMYVAFIFSYTELTTAIPHAGGPFAYGLRAYGPTGGYFAGMATLIEFVFAPPAISLAIGAYLNVQFPGLDPKLAAVGAYVVFMTLNILGMHIAANFELFVTIIAIGELLVFMGVVSPGFSWTNFTANGWAGSDTFTIATWGGILASIPFAIWFFLAIEGVAMAAEETKDPHRTARLYLRRAHSSGFGTGGNDFCRRCRRLARAVQPQRSLAASDENDCGRKQRLAAYAGMAGFIWLGCQLSRHHHGLFAPNFRPEPRRLSAADVCQGKPTLPHPAPCRFAGRRGGHCRHFQRQLDCDRRPAAHRQHHHHVGIRRLADVHHRHV